jgi:alpha-tubulin suppressor-like RCC1 family protein
VGGYTDWCQVAAGQLSSAAIRTNGELWTWGLNNCGQLGHNTVTCRSSPVSVVGGFNDWCQVHMQDSVTAAIRTNGSLWSWGYNRCGQLGDGTIIHRSSPVSVVGGFTDWCQVANSLAAIRSNGSLWTWGYNGKGRLGDGTTVNKSSPISVTGGFSDWTQIVGDATRSLAIRTYTVPACY